MNGKKRQRHCGEYPYDERRDDDVGEEGEHNDIEERIKLREAEHIYRGHQEDGNDKPLNKSSYERTAVELHTRMRDQLVNSNV